MGTTKIDRRNRLPQELFQQYGGLSGIWSRQLRLALCRAQKISTVAGVKLLFVGSNARILAAAGGAHDNQRPQAEPAQFVPLF
ncbi:hypothetical protein PoB_005075400 [Plakobranchus ocellatus]|uniref:Uncharacterized protein n=1 Tax=Plakobranchus ocellatus TaxID=259542 RepID=A0AAV4BZF8_9GAST|nr:hypothetical protein PoB_005075400 [Plakobranchus ocellatus]